MAEDIVSNGREVAPVVLRGVSVHGTPELPCFSDTGQRSDDCSRCKIFMNHYHRRGTWGFVIFRTVYTPESDRCFKSVLSKIERHVRAGLARPPFMADERHPAERDCLVSMIMARFQNTIFEDKTLFDHATARDLAPYFRLWLADIERDTRYNGYLECYAYNNFIIIDEESLQAIEAVPEDISHDRSKRSPKVAVQVVHMSDKRPKLENATGLWEEYHNGTDSHD